MSRIIDTHQAVASLVNLYGGLLIEQQKVNDRTREQAHQQITALEARIKELEGEKQAAAHEFDARTRQLESALKAQKDELGAEIIRLQGRD